MYEMDKRLQDEIEAGWLSLTDREEEYIEALSFPQKQLKAALEAARSTAGDAVGFVARDFVDYASGDREIIHNERVASFDYFHTAAASFGKLLEDRYNDKKPSGSYFTLEEPISPRCFLPNKLSRKPDTRLEQLYLALTALRKVWHSNPPNKERYLEIELERRFFKYYFREQFETPKPHVKFQELSYTPLPGEFQFRVEYNYL
jgi:hypothetical protein